MLNKLDPKFEKQPPPRTGATGVYYDAMDGLSYKDYSIRGSREVSTRVSPKCWPSNFQIKDHRGGLAEVAASDSVQSRRKGGD